MRTTTQRYDRSTYCVVLIAEEWTGNGFNDTHKDRERQSETFSEKPKKQGEVTHFRVASDIV